MFLKIFIRRLDWWNLLASLNMVRGTTTNIADLNETPSAASQVKEESRGIQCENDQNRKGTGLGLIKF